MFNFFQKVLRENKKSTPYKLGDVFAYRETCLIVVDVRESDISGVEYMVYLDGEVHGWLTHSILKQLEERNDKEQ